MDWKELKEKSKRLQSEGKTEEEEEAVEMLKDEIGAFAEECFEHPEKLVDTIPDLGGAIQNNPVLAGLLSFFFSRYGGGWGR